VDQKETYDEALLQLSSGKPQAAAEICAAGLTQYPGDGNLLCLAAKTNLALKHFDLAESQCEEAIRLFPDFAHAFETYGDVLLVQSKIPSAKTAYETAMRLDPARAITHDKIDRAKLLEKELAEEKSRRQKSASTNFEEELKKAREFEAIDDLRSAEMIYRECLTKNPNHLEAARLLAGIAVKNNRFRDAEVLLIKVVTDAPDYVRAWVDLSNAQREMDKFDEAVESAAKVLELAPKNSESHMVYASAIGMTGGHEAAIAAYEAALAITPDRAGAMSSMAHHQKTIGLQAEAIASYRNAVRAKPDHAEAYWSLANLKTFSFEDEEVRTIEALLENHDLPDESRAQLHNALGLEFESRKNYARAFEHLEKCNAVQRQLESYDPVETEGTYDRLIELFNPEFLVKNSTQTTFEVTPIFVVGLPRSGSTLIEQILASHSQVDGTHELGDLSRAVQSVRREKSKHTRFPEALTKLNPDDWRRIGENYLSRTEIFRAGAPYFVDKNPNNFIYAGVLKLALPNAKIINARRHPLDSCFGSFKQLFASGQPFSYDLTELGEYYLQYQRLMEFWHEALPGFVLDVQYEEVVADLDNQVDRMLDFCGLRFEDTCLRFHETERAVKTASSEQVRRPIYSSSVNLWRNYETHLGELIETLEPVLNTLPASQQPRLSSRT